MEQDRMVEESDNQCDPVQAEAGDWIRERDDQLPAELWDPTSGSMVRPPQKQPCLKSLVEKMVAAELARLKRQRGNSR
jgi:hypothetical protein